jgi:hypothetical protein
MSNPFRELYDYAWSVTRFLAGTNRPLPREDWVANLKLLSDLADRCIAASVDGFSRLEIEHRVRVLQEELRLAILLGPPFPDLIRALSDVWTLVLVTDNAANTPGQEKSASSAAVEALLDDMSQKILTIARSARSVDEKMRDICRVDRRFLGYASERWGKLLSVTASAIRQTPFWIEMRKSAPDAD